MQKLRWGSEESEGAERRGLRRVTSDRRKSWDADGRLDPL
jgi:hypothetical protein